MLGFWTVVALFGFIVFYYSINALIDIKKEAELSIKNSCTFLEIQISRKQISEEHLEGFVNAKTRHLKRRTRKKIRKCLLKKK